MSNDDALLIAVGRTMKSELGKLRQRLEHAEARAARLEERLAKSLDRIDGLEKLAEQTQPVLRHVRPDGSVVLIKALSGTEQ